MIIQFKCIIFLLGLAYGFDLSSIEIKPKIALDKSIENEQQFTTYNSRSVILKTRELKDENEFKRFIQEAMQMFATISNPYGGTVSQSLGCHNKQKYKLVNQEKAIFFLFANDRLGISSCRENDSRYKVKIYYLKCDKKFLEIRMFNLIKNKNEYDVQCSD